MRRLAYSARFAVSYLTPWVWGRFRRRRTPAPFGSLETTWHIAGGEPR